jgi:hypothetical protein
MKSMISRSVLWTGLSLLLIAAAIRVGQSAATMLGDAEAQALIQTLQGQRCDTCEFRHRQSPTKDLTESKTIVGPPKRPNVRLVAGRSMTGLDGAVRFRKGALR